MKLLHPVSFCIYFELILATQRLKLHCRRTSEDISNDAFCALSRCQSVHRRPSTRWNFKLLLNITVLKQQLQTILFHLMMKYAFIFIYETMIIQTHITPLHPFTFVNSKVDKLNFDLGVVYFFSSTMITFPQFEINKNIMLCCHLHWTWTWMELLIYKLVVPLPDRSIECSCRK